jgi:hypothetical protein
MLVCRNFAAIPLCFSQRAYAKSPVPHYACRKELRSVAMRLVAVVILAAVTFQALAQQPIPTCTESVTSYQTNLAQQFKLDTMLQVKAEEAATFFVISDVITLAEDNRGLRCQGTLTVRKELENALKTRPTSNNTVNPLDISYSRLIMIVNAGTLAPVRWEITRLEDGEVRIRDISNQ